VARVSEEVQQAGMIAEGGVLDVDPTQEVLSLPYTITSYGADFLVDGLVSRMASGDIVIPSFDPEYSGTMEIHAFQRGFVWSRPQMDRFIESLLLGLPVPGIFLVREPNNVFLVLDGQQRLRTLQAFYAGELSNVPYQLEFVQDPWIGATYAALDPEDRRRLDSSIMHATILRQEEPVGEQRAVYTIFERLNTGGTPLQPQEIRVALYGGPFISLIRTLNNNKSWRGLYGNRSPRLKDHELILRFFAMFESSSTYSRPLKGFLNEYLSVHRYRTRAKAESLVSLFEHTTDAINSAIGRTAFRPVRALNAAVAESMMVGVARRLQEEPITDLRALDRAYRRLIANEDYMFATTSSTAAEESVEQRIELATKAFRTIR